jgi:predicted Zn-dependent protease
MLKPRWPLARRLHRDSRYRRSQFLSGGGAAGFWIENGKIAFPVKGLIGCVKVAY